MNMGMSWMGKYRPGFTLLELILVIAILGIVASLGSSLIVKAYESYIMQRAVHRASLATELAATQLVNRLTYRINRTTVAKDPANPADFVAVSDISTTGDSIHTALEWIAYDNDSFSAEQIPGWSAYCDVSDTNNSRAQFVTPGSDLSIADTIIDNLSQGSVKLFGSSGNRPAIFFSGPGSNAYDPANTVQYLPECMGLDYGTHDTSCALAVSGQHSSGAHDLLIFTDAARKTEQKYLYERYKLAWSAYALVPVAMGGNLYELKLYYNYQPWLGSGNEYNSNTASSSTLLKNVSVFKFSESGGTLRFKICVQENVAGDRNITICKEKAVIR